MLSAASLLSGLKLSSMHHLHIGMIKFTFLRLNSDHDRVITDPNSKWVQRRPLSTIWCKHIIHHFLILLLQLTWSPSYTRSNNLLYYEDDVITDSSTKHLHLSCILVTTRNKCVHYTQSLQLSLLRHLALWLSVCIFSSQLRIVLVFRLIYTKHNLLIILTILCFLVLMIPKNHLAISTSRNVLPDVA